VVQRGSAPSALNDQFPPSVAKARAIPRSAPRGRLARAWADFRAARGLLRSPVDRLHADPSAAVRSHVSIRRPVTEKRAAIAIAAMIAEIATRDLAQAIAVTLLAATIIADVVIMSALGEIDTGVEVGHRPTVDAMPIAIGRAPDPIAEIVPVPTAKHRGPSGAVAKIARDRAPKLLVFRDLAHSASRQSCAETLTSEDLSPPGRESSRPAFFAAPEWAILQQQRCKIGGSLTTFVCSLGGPQIGCKTARNFATRALQRCIQLAAPRSE
jgi:hypothetical protein